jgi:hypothetical protein
VLFRVGGSTVLKSNSAAVDPAQLVHCVAEDVVAPLRLGIVGTPAEPYENEGHPPTLLRVRRYRPSRRTTDNSQKFPPPYRLKRVL